ncbi:asparaginase [Enteractinococcus coprophilus]|uniref:Asparaginase n=1 Tax=Enteractinococcus coprophilus TaxID=1027633 RepID=A0A543AM78_9MICC|nr:asparaginase [Enteractinococcus coprophilus]TQL73668.1 asparaginase [Enteractinococcus coprophilus]
MSEPIRASDAAQLAVTTRNGFVENRFFGSAVVVDPDGGILASVGDPDAGVYPRSALKPFQAIAALRCGAHLSGEKLALACGSHIGSTQHQEIASAVLSDVGLTAENLGCPAVYPSSASQVAQAALQVAPLPLERSRLAHNCSGKHAGFLSATVTAGEDPSNYLHPDAPVQSEVLTVLEQYCQTSITQVGVDGCGAPTPVMSLTSLARGFGALGRAVTDRGAELQAAMVARAMLDYPHAVQGPKRPDTVVLESLELLVKTGADGIVALAAPDGTAVAVSMIDSTHRATHLVALVLLANFAPEVLPVDAMRDVIERIVPPVYGGGQPVGGVKVAPAVLRLLS